MAPREMQVEMHPAFETVELFGLGSAEDWEWSGSASMLREGSGFRTDADRHLEISS